MWRRWNELGSLGRFELWTRASGYVLLAAVPVLAVILAAGQRQVRVPGLAVFLLLSVAQAGVCIALLHAGRGCYLAAGPPPDRWLVASAAALTAAGVLAGAAAFPAFTQPPGAAYPPSLLVAALFGGALTVALTPLLSLRALTALVLVSAAAASVLTASIGRAGAGAYGLLLIAASWQYTFIVGIGVLTCRGSAWTLRIMSELDRSRTAHARLSVAEERLRFARDLRTTCSAGTWSLIAAIQSEPRRGTGAPGRPGRRRADAPGAPGGAMESLRGNARGRQRIPHRRPRHRGWLGRAGCPAVCAGDGAAASPATRRAFLLTCRPPWAGWSARAPPTSSATATPPLCTIRASHPVIPRAPPRGDAQHRPTTACGHAGHRIWRQRAGRASASGWPGSARGSITTGHPPNGHFRLEASLPARGTGVTAETPAP